MFAKLQTICERYVENLVVRNVGFNPRSSRSCATRRKKSGISSEMERVQDVVNAYSKGRRKLEGVREIWWVNYTDGIIIPVESGKSPARTSGR